MYYFAANISSCTKQIDMGDQVAKKEGQEREKREPVRIVIANKK